MSEPKVVYEVSEEPVLTDVESGTSSLATKHIFQDPDVAEYYRDLYEKAKYEGRFHFDPKLEWTPQEEKALVRKTELRVVFFAFVMFLALDFDRWNISNAVSGTFLKDLGLTTNDYNLGSTINLVCFLSAELPSQLISKKVGPDRWVPTQIVLWSIISVSQVGLRNKAGFYATRALLGFCSGGFLPDVCLWMSYFYTGKELPSRLSYFYLANPLTRAIAALVAYGIFHLEGSHGIAGWRWLFLIEGLFTFTIGVVAFFRMPPSAVQTKTWFRKKGWYTDREEKIMVNRILRDDPSKGDMHNRQALSLKLIFKSIMDFDVWPIYAIRIMGDIGNAPVLNYMTIILRKLGFSTLNTNLLTIPYNIVSMFTMLAMPYISSYFNEVALIMTIPSLWNIALLAVLRFWPGAQVDVWATYAVLVIILSAPTASVLTISWCSSNANSVRTRTVSAAVVNMFSQTAGIISSQMYRSDDAPLYHRGNQQLLIIAISNVVLCVLGRQYYIWRNKQRDKEWNVLTHEKQMEYRSEAKVSGNKRLDFRFVY